VLDTGFTDYLTLPRAIVTDLQLTAMDTAQCQLADGRIVTMESFAAVVRWDGSPREILALAAEGDPLLGMSLLKDSRVTLDVRAGGEVRIEPLD
jgi:clan AA aspartic protease